MDNLDEVQTTIHNIDANETDGKYLTFWVGRQLFGLPIIEVVQIVQMQKITEIPEYPDYAKGIINLRGAVIPVIDMRLRVGKGEIPYEDKTCIIVTSLKDKTTGFIVDSVEEVTDIAEDQISNPPGLSTYDFHSEFLTGIGRHEDKMVLLISTEKMMYEAQ